MAISDQSSGPLVIATGITTLDEARYFSAMGAAWLGFDGSRLSFTEIRAMADWVVGPQNFIEFESPDEDLLRQIDEVSSIQGISIPGGADVPDWYQGIIVIRQNTGSEEQWTRNTVFSIIHQSVFDAKRNETSRFWVELSDMTNLSFVKSADIDGLVIRCNPEMDQEDAFERYDQFFEALEEG